MLKVTNLTKYYGNNKALDNLSFELHEGKIYGFLGPNGAGKTTTMNIITGYIGASEGTVTICNYDIVEEPEEAKKCFGYLPENPPLYLDMTVYEYLKFVAELKLIPKNLIQSQLNNIIDKLSLSDVKNKLIKYLSKGYKQRVGLAGALISDPKIIILDEPTVGLDPIQVTEFRQLIKSYKDKHIILLSSHIMQEIAAICDEVLIISNGKLVANNSIESLSLYSKLIIDYSVKGNKATIIDVFEKYDNITLSEIVEEDNICNFKININDSNEQMQEKIFFDLANKGIVILESKMLKNNLEDVFADFIENKGGKEQC